MPWCYKDLVVTLAHIPDRIIIMDIVVVYIPAQFGILISRYWGMKPRGFVKLDLTYATILVFGGEQRRLYIKSRFTKTIRKEGNPNNSFFYGQDFGQDFVRGVAKGDGLDSSKG